jgi:thiamine-phosphate pyrophosphorylase
VKPTVPRLQLITDTQLQQTYTHLDLVRFARDVGAPAVQVRWKEFSFERDAEMLFQIAELLVDSSTQLIINDHVTMAAALPHAGAHVGNEDLAPADARALLGPYRLLGATAHTEAEVMALAEAPIDYLGIGPVYGTQSKQWLAGPLPPLGTEGLRRLCNLSTIPVIAIGSIDQTNLAAVLDAGAYGVAVLSAFVAAERPWVAAEQLVRAVAEALLRKS